MAAHQDMLAGGLSLLLHSMGETITYYHRAVGTSESATWAVFTEGLDDSETGLGQALGDGSALTTVPVEGDEIARADGKLWRVQRVLPAESGVTELGLLRRQPVV